MPTSTFANEGSGTAGTIVTSAPLSGDGSGGSPVTLPSGATITSPTLVTPTLGVATATSVSFDGGGFSGPITLAGTTDLFGDSTLTVGNVNGYIGVSFDGTAEISFPSGSNFYVPDGTGYGAGFNVFDPDGSNRWFRVTSTGVEVNTGTTMQGSLYMTKDYAAPGSVLSLLQIDLTSKGDNTTSIGGRGLLIHSDDRNDVDATNKGILYGASFAVGPKVTRNNGPVDDATAVTITNTGTRAGTDALYFGHNAGVLDAVEWGGGIIVSESNAAYGINLIGTMGVGFNIRNAAIVGDIAAPNAVDFIWKMAADNNDDATDQWIERIAATGNAYTLENNSNVNLTLSTGGNLTARGVVKASGGYQSSDGSAGATGTATAVNTLTIKNGLIVTIA